MYAVFECNICKEWRYKFECKEKPWEYYSNTCPECMDKHEHKGESKMINQDQKIDFQREEYKEICVDMRKLLSDEKEIGVRKEKLGRRLIE